MANPDFTKEEVWRLEALAAAQGVSEQGASSDTVLAKARKFFVFLKGEQDATE